MMIFSINKKRTKELWQPMIQVYFSCKMCKTSPKIFIEKLNKNFIQNICFPI